MDDVGNFYEEDEPVEQIEEAFNAGPQGLTEEPSYLPPDTLLGSPQTVACASVETFVSGGLDVRVDFTSGRIPAAAGLPALGVQNDDHPGRSGNNH